MAAAASASTVAALEEQLRSATSTISLDNATQALRICNQSEI
jgi:hypothetical protein